MKWNNIIQSKSECLCFVQLAIRCSDLKVGSNVMHVFGGEGKMIEYQFMYICMNVCVFILTVYIHTFFIYRHNL